MRGIGRHAIQLDLIDERKTTALGDLGWKGGWAHDINDWCKLVLDTIYHTWRIDHEPELDLVCA